MRGLEKFEENYKFIEVQHVNKWFLWLLLFLAFFFVIVGIIDGFQDNMANIGGANYQVFFLTLILLVVITGIIFLGGIKLYTLIDDVGIYFQWKPIFKNFNRIDYELIERIELIDIRKLGLGLNNKDKNLKIFNSDSKKGFYIKTFGGYNVIIGSKRIKELDLLFSSLAEEKKFIYSNKELI